MKEIILNKGFINLVKKDKWEIVRTKGACAVLFIDKDGFMYFTKQYRPAINKYILEVPAETYDKSKKLKPIDYAYNALREELGVIVDKNKFRNYGHVYTSPGYTDEKIDLFFYAGYKEKYRQVKQKLDKDEKIEIIKINIYEINKHPIIDLKTALLICIIYIMVLIMKYLFKETDKIKIISSENYNYFFNKVNGEFYRWGKNHEDNPTEAPTPELLDIEISTICDMKCNSCYKDNTSIGKNMSLQTFKNIISKFKINNQFFITQIAFGIGSLSANPDLFSIMKYCREIGIIPNITINGNGLTAQTAKHLSMVVGAISVSHYSDDTCFNAVKLLTDVGLTQVNIHQIVSVETYYDCMDLLSKAKTDSRLEKLNAIVFLALKKKGRGINMSSLSLEKYQEIFIKAFKQEVRFGMDSCSAPILLDFINKNPQYKDLEQYCEPCESGLFSWYINVEGIGFPCSFCEEKTIKFNLLDYKNFLDVWYDKELIKWKDNLIETRNLGCPIYKIYE